MTCHEVQLELSLYLYGELDFAQEEAVELHLAECALCQMALAREKTWHSAASAETSDVSLELLSRCRQDLHASLKSAKGAAARHYLAKELRGSWGGALDSASVLRGFLGRISGAAFRWPDWMRSWGFEPSSWSTRIAFASFLVLIGFVAGRFVSRTGFSPDTVGEMGFIDPSSARVRDIQMGAGNRVRIIVDQVREREISGQVNDALVRQLLLSATKDPEDPGLRVDSVEILKDQSGSDVRDALLYAVRHDTNAGVRLKALEGLRRFTTDPETREGLAFVLQHDENVGVRSQAIDILARSDSPVNLSPAIVQALQQVMHSQQSDEYVRMRCFQLLSETNASPDIY